MGLNEGMSQTFRSVAAGAVLFLGAVFVVIWSQRLIPNSPNGADTLTASTDKRRSRDLYSHAYTPEGSQEAGAVCMDGSLPVYYLRPGWGTGAKNWLVFFEGGGWCWSEEECLDRSRMYLGSSQTYPRRLRLQEMMGNYFSASQQDNEELYNWNHVYIKYCDGTSFSGDREEPLTVHGRRLMFRGKRIHRVVIDSLLRHRGMVDADTVVVSGCSAGALASLIQLDTTKEMIVQAQAAAGRNTSALVVGLPDSGFFPDEDSAPCNYASKMKIIYDMGHMQASAHPQCVQENKGHEHRCIFAQWLLPHIQTPVFALQSSLDSWVVANVQCEDYHRHTKEHRLLQPHGLQQLKDRFSKSFWSAHRGAALLDTCHHHCHLRPGHVILKAWTGLTVKGMSQQKAFLQWLKDVDAGRFQPGEGRWEQEALGSCPRN